MILKYNKLICIVLLTILLLSVSIQVCAAGDIIRDAKDFINKGKNEDKIINEDVIADVSDSVYNILLSIAVVVAVIVGAFLGIQLMMAGAEGKAEVKESLLPYVIGCVVAFGAFGIWKIVVTMAQKI